MKIIFYNMAYGTGLNGSWKQYVNNMWRFLWTPIGAFDGITQTLRNEEADVICLAEVDNGSLRARFRCQAKSLAEQLNFPVFKTESKYKDWSVWKWMTLVRKHHDAILTKRKGVLRRHNLRTGMKKLVQEFQTDGLSIFTVHLAVLSEKARRKQMRELSEILKNCKRPYLVCGDFNLHKGLHEIKEFVQETKAKLVETPMTFPSFRPNRTIDLFLSSPGLKVLEAGVINVHHSDHLPVWVKLDTNV